MSSFNPLPPQTLQPPPPFQAPAEYESPTLPPAEDDFEKTGPNKSPFQRDKGIRLQVPRAPKRRPPQPKLLMIKTAPSLLRV
jgi:hypothetical protein